VRRSIATVALSIAAIFCSGCPALMIPSLAYSGYKYEKDKNKPAEKSEEKKSASTAPRQKVPDNSIE
jgi:hypothetical protein